MTMHSPMNKGFMDHYTQKYWRTSYWMFKNSYPRSIIHVPLYYHVNPNILSLVGDALPGYGCGSPNHRCI